MMGNALEIPVVVQKREAPGTLSNFYDPNEELPFDFTVYWVGMH